MHFRTTIKVIDAIMGTGKTSYAIQMMNSKAMADTRFLYITPFLDEVQRIIDECPDRAFVQPKENRAKWQNKSDSLKDLIMNGRNIASTHALFERIDQEAVNLLKAQGYILVMDEVMSVLEPVEESQDRVNGLFQFKVLEIDDDDPQNGETIKKVKLGPSDTFKEFAFYRSMAEMDRLVLVNGKLLMWLFPSSVFSAFDEVYVLTYLFDGQVQKSYYDLSDISYEYYTVAGSRDKGYSLVPYDFGKQAELERIAKFRELVTICDHEKLNRIGRDRTALSCNWYKDAGERLMKVLQNNMYNYFRNIVKGKASDNMWSVFKDHTDTLGGKGYKSGFVPCNERATNKYRHKKNLAYCCNMFLKPEIERFFTYRNVRVDKDLYALSALIQWIWRSQIRDGKPINVYIPSQRMRGLFIGWLNQL
jgi:hypothetical protein